jgi:hypothetical protein
MNLWVLTGYVAHAVLTAYWFWVVASTAPQLRRGTRDRRVRARVLLIKTAALALTALLVAIIHYWATAWWQVAVALPVAVGLGVLLRREYRRTVAAPRHRLTIARRAKTRDLRRRPRGGHAPAHLRVDEPASRIGARLAE